MKINVHFDPATGPSMRPHISVEARMSHEMHRPMMHAGATHFSHHHPEGAIFGALVVVAPLLGLVVMQAAMRGHGGHWQSDPNIRLAMNQCQLAAAQGLKQVTIFVPHPSCIKPEFERRQIPRTPGEALPSAKGGLESPAGPQRGVSMKPASTPATDLGKPDPKQPFEAFQSQRAAPAPKQDEGLLRDHATYSEVRQTLFDGFVNDVERKPEHPPTAFRQPEQCIKLDAAASEFFSRPTEQRDQALQRALFVSLLVAPTPLAEAKQLLQQHYGERLGFDDGMLNKLAQAYGPAKDAHPVTPERGLQADATGQQAKVKRERLPEEMLLQQQNELRAAPKKGATNRRVDSLHGDEPGGQSTPDQSEQEDEESADTGEHTL